MRDSMGEGGRRGGVIEVVLLLYFGGSRSLICWGTRIGGVVWVLWRR